MRELVSAPRAPSRCVSTALGDDLANCIERQVIACFFSHHFAEKRPVEREKRRALFRSRRVISVKPVHHESELKARREGGRSFRLHDVHAYRALLYLIEHAFEAVHIERVLKNVTIRFDENRKARELLHGLKKIE